MQNPIVVFDLDGTLADTAGDLIATLNVILETENLPPVPLEQARELIGAGAKALIERGFLAHERALTPERHEELFDRFIVHYGNNLRVHSVLFDGIETALDRLEADGWRFAVCTNKIEKHSVKLLELFGIADRFKAICGRDTFPTFKPDPAHLLMTIERAGGDPRRAIMVGDSRTDIDTAKAARIPSIGVPFGYTDVPMHALGADTVIEHFDELYDAVRTIDGGRDRV
ncbi:MAG: phosphoglycolate phosphatase [Beijerinckiaceae bacterium]|nr:phosphoglycolate phosphatase [Beijerinckiaceae bacterium]